MFSQRTWLLREVDSWITSGSESPSQGTVHMEKSNCQCIFVPFFIFAFSTFPPQSGLQLALYGRYFFSLALHPHSSRRTLFSNEVTCFFW